MHPLRVAGTGLGRGRTFIHAYTAGHWKPFEDGEEHAYTGGRWKRVGEGEEHAYTVGHWKLFGQGEEHA
jgi:hypothetical protein